jgi:RNA ligase (TIGR02306 family)
MSTFAVKVVTVDKVEPHDNADRLEIAQILGWQVVVQKGVYKPGDLAIYIPLDAVLPVHLKEKYELPPDHKRMKTIKLRGALSQGMLVPAEAGHVEGQDVTEELGITKYEPPTRYLPANMRGTQRKAGIHDDRFIKYTGIENFKNYPKTLEEGEEVVVTEKIHGSNFRAMHLGKPTFWTRVKRWFGSLRGMYRVGYNGPTGNPLYQDLYVGSHNINLNYKEGNAYWEAALQLGLDKKLADHPFKIVFGEVYGSTQKGFPYDVGEGENTIRVFDIYDAVEQRYLNYDEFKEFCDSLSLPTVPLLYRGPWSLEVRKQHIDGKTVLMEEKKAHIREGFVVRPVVERHDRGLGRVILKCISDAYLIAQGKKKDEEATEFH